MYTLTIVFYIVNVYIKLFQPFTYIIISVISNLSHGAIFLTNRKEIKHLIVNIMFSETYLRLPFNTRVA